MNDPDEIENTGLEGNVNASPTATEIAEAVGRADDGPAADPAAPPTVARHPDAVSPSHDSFIRRAGDFMAHLEHVVEQDFNHLTEVALAHAKLNLKKAMAELRALGILPTL